MRQSLVILFLAALYLGTFILLQSIVPDPYMDEVSM